MPAKPIDTPSGIIKEIISYNLYMLLTPRNYAVSGVLFCFENRGFQGGSRHFYLDVKHKPPTDCIKSIQNIQRFFSKFIL